MSGFPVLGGERPPRDPAALARTILREQRFRVRTHAAQGHTWWDRLREWIGNQWDRLMEAFAHHVKIGRMQGAALGDILVVALVLLVVVVGVRLLLNMARESSASGGAAISALPEHADAAALFESAQRAARMGTYAVAIAYAFRAALAALDARGALRDDPSRTVNECRRDVRSRAPRFHAPFEAIARAFTAAVYAEDRVGAGEWSAVERAYAAFSAADGDAA